MLAFRPVTPAVAGASKSIREDFTYWDIYRLIPVELIATVQTLARSIFRVAHLAELGEGLDLLTERIRQLVGIHIRLPRRTMEAAICSDRLPLA